ncbi:MAG: rod shape-determining protein [Paludibacteraceae bacterium]|nr:rod shape-determining protein [Paludibacteraceae bacterium]
MKKQLTQNLPLVAIDLGSHSVRAIAAERVDRDTLHILGYEQSTKYPSIDRGVVQQVSNTGFMISETLKLLSNRIGVADLPTAFVLTGGRTMQSVVVGSKRDLIRPHEITTNILNECQQECKQKIETKYPDAAVLGLVPACYILDGKQQDELPTPAQRTRQFEVLYTAFVGKKELETKLTESFNRGNKSMEQVFPRPEALLSAFAAEDSSVLENGCAVIDMGAQTTTLSIYRGNHYLLNRVIPLGGYHISRNIEQQGIPFVAAEQIKCQIGVASPRLVKANKTVRLRADNGESTIQFTIAELAEVIEQKLDEIFTPIVEQLSQHPIRTVFLTGGGSLLMGIDQYLQQKTNLRVLYGSHACLLDHDTPDEFCSPQFSSLVGALILGADYRDAHPAETVRKPNFFERIAEKTGELFIDENNY